MNCKNCGAVITEEDKFCYNCGNKVEQEAEIVEEVDVVDEAEVVEEAKVVKKVEERKAQVEEKSNTTEELNNIDDKNKDEKKFNNLSSKEKVNPLRIEEAININKYLPKIKESTDKICDEFKELRSDKEKLKDLVLKAFKIVLPCLIISVILYAILKYSSEKPMTIGPNIIDIYGLAFLNSYTIQKMTIKLPVIILALIPSVTIYLVGKNLYQDKKTTMEHLVDYGCIAFAVAIISAVLFLLGTNKIVDMGEMSITGSFEVFQGFISTFLFVFVLQVIYSSLAKSKESLGEMSYLTGIMFKGFKYLMIYSLVIAVISSIVLLAKDVPFLALVMILPNVILTISLFFIGGNLGSGKGINTINILDLTIKSKIDNMIENKAMWIIASIILLIGAIIIVYTMVIELKKEKYFKNLMLLALINGIFYCVIGAFLSVKVSGAINENIKGSLKIGFNNFNTFISIFIFIAIIGGIYYFAEQSLAQITSIVKSGTLGLLLVIAIVSQVVFWAINDKGVYQSVERITTNILTEPVERAVGRDSTIKELDLIGKMLNKDRR